MTCCSTRQIRSYKGSGYSLTSRWPRRSSIRSKPNLYTASSKSSQRMCPITSQQRSDLMIKTTIAKCRLNISTLPSSNLESRRLPTIMMINRKYSSKKIKARMIQFYFNRKSKQKLNLYFHSTGIRKVPSTNNLRGGQAGKSTKRALEAKKEIFWELKLEESPQVEFEFYADEFSISSFIIDFWASKRKYKDDLEMMEYRHMGNNYLSMAKFSLENVTVIAETESMLIQEVVLQESIMDQGITIGLWKGQFIVKQNPFLKQMMCGVMTEEGITKKSALILRKGKYNYQTIKEIENLLQLHISLEEITSQLSNKQKPPKMDEFKQQIQKMIEILQDPLSFTKMYQNEQELIKSQQVLIDISKHLLENIDYLNESIKDLYFQALILMLNREELELAHICFDKNQFDKFQDNQNSKSFQEKIRIQLYYQNFIYTYIPQLLDKIQNRAISKKEQEFIFTFIVICYFRIPMLREFVLSIAQFDNQPLPEYTSHETDINGEHYNQHFGLLTLESRFFGVVSSTEKGKKASQELQLALQSLNWNFKDINHFLIPFVHYWCQYIMQKFCIDKSVPWELIPGYEKIVRGFLQLLKYHDSKQTPSIMQNASCSLLMNQMLLPSFLSVIYNKTRLFDAIQVCHTMESIDQWLQYSVRMFKKLPTNFDYNLFFKGIFITIDSDHSLSISKAIWVLYNIFPAFSTQPKKQLCDFLFGDVFFRLFMHWSTVVRNTFQYFLIYRIQHRHRQLKSDINTLRDITKELQYFFIKTRQEEKDILINDMIYLKFTKLIDIVKKIKTEYIAFQKAKRNSLELQLREKSFKLKLLKKKMGHKNKQKEMPWTQDIFKIELGKSVEFEEKKSDEALIMKQISSQQNTSKSDIPDFTIRSKISCAESAGNPSNIPQLSSYNFMEEERHEESYSNVPKVLEDDFQSFSSFIDLEQIVKEVEKDQEHKLVLLSYPFYVQNTIRNYKNKEKEKSDYDRKGHNKELRKSSVLRQEQKFKTVIQQINYKWDFGNDIQIPNELLKYSPQAYDEWFNLQKEYQRWFFSKKSELARSQSGENAQIALKILDLPVPNLVVRIPKDESNQEASGEY